MSTEIEKSRVSVIDLILAKRGYSSESLTTILNNYNCPIENRKLTEDEKSTILQAAIRAPTAGAMMLYTIIEVEDQQLKDQLAVTCDNQPFIATAPYMLLFLADYQRWMDLYEAAGCEARARELNITPRAGFRE